VNFTAQIDFEAVSETGQADRVLQLHLSKERLQHERPRLVALASELGAKPIEIWEDREYQSEAVQCVTLWSASTTNRSIALSWIACGITLPFMPELPVEVLAAGQSASLCKLTRTGLPNEVLPLN
jgi:hypothetical protein